MTGWTPNGLRHAVTTGDLRRIRPGVYAPARAIGADVHAERRVDIHERAVAAALTNQNAHVSHTSCAAMHDLPVWYLPSRPCITVPPHFVGDIDDAHLHRAALPDAHVLIDGAPHLTIERTVVDVGREHGVLSALVLADAALHLERTSVNALRATLQSCKGWPGIRAAREAVDLADPFAESPLETASRYKLRGLVPTPQSQVWIYDLYGTFLGRADFYWDEFGVVGEVDGMTKYDGRDDLVLQKEKVRQMAFERCKLNVVRWGRSDLDPIDGLVHRLHQSFEDGRRRPGARLWLAKAPRRSA